MSKQAKQADGKICEEQLLNFLVNSFDEKVALDLGDSAEIDAEETHQLVSYLLSSLKAIAIGIILEC